VKAESPVALTNPQQGTVVWPIWGAAFTLGDPVVIDAHLAPGGAGACGIVIAGPGEPDERTAVRILAVDGTWVAQETSGDDVINEEGVTGIDGGAFSVSVSPDAVTVTSGADHGTSLKLFTPLAESGEAAGVYAHLESGATLDIRSLTSSQPLPAHTELDPTLRTLADERGTEFGTALDIWPPLHDLEFESLLGQQFTAVTPTEFYWATTRGEDSDFFFIPSDLSVNYASVHGQDVSGMFLVWDYELPEWVLDIAATEDALALGQVYDEHITELVTRYADEVDSWVVVNEAIWGTADTGEDEARLAETVWLDVLGDDYIERAFREARAADPDAELIYNETGAEALGDKSDFLYEMLSEFVTRGVPVDAVGLQFHVEAANPPDPQSVRQNMQRLADLGLTVRITELDVTVEGDSPEHLELQAEVYREVVETCLEVAACAGTTVFGFSDRYSWDELGEALPLLFTADYKAKPAFHSVQEALR
jgi:endo-1,4-beta-xylanase